MPNYQLKCVICDTEKEVFKKLTDYGKWPDCCGAMMAQVLTPVNGSVENLEYKSMLTGEIVTNMRRHRQLLRDYNCVEVGNEKPKPRSFEYSKADKFALRKQIHDMIQDPKLVKKVKEQSLAENTQVL